MKLVVFFSVGIIVMGMMDLLYQYLLVQFGLNDSETA